MIENVMNDLAEIKKEEKIKELERKIKYQREMIEEIKKRNPFSGDISFEEYQLCCMEEELKEIKK